MTGARLPEIMPPKPWPRPDPLPPAPRFSVRLVVYGQAAPAGSKTIGRTSAGRTFVRDASSKSAPWKRQVAQEAGEAMLILADRYGTVGMEGRNLRDVKA